jgi:hypothetical protein
MRVQVNTFPDLNILEVAFNMSFLYASSTQVWSKYVLHLKVSYIVVHITYNERQIEQHKNSQYFFPWFVGVWLDRTMKNRFPNIFYIYVSLREYYLIRTVILKIYPEIYEYWSYLCFRNKIYSIWNTIIIWLRYYPHMQHYSKITELNRMCKYSLYLHLGGLMILGKAPLCVINLHILSPDNDKGV